ncbi:MAG TPA: Holliday junction resolvase RuvX [Pyrinomonadaceae bacterium]|nr:Holliday junction resolvase RuvX [Pyrinomonadaceae bacterium]
MTRTRPSCQTHGPVLALDLGEKLVGAAISDAQLVTIKRLTPLKRSNWKRLLIEVETLVERFDAQTLVIGLPLRLDGTVGTAAERAERVAENFAKSLDLPVYLQDERLTSFDARETLLDERRTEHEIRNLIDGESAALILRDFLQNTEHRQRVGIAEPQS